MKQSCKGRTFPVTTAWSAQQRSKCQSHWMRSSSRKQRNNWCPRVFRRLRLASYGFHYSQPHLWISSYVIGCRKISDVTTPLFPLIPQGRLPDGASVSNLVDVYLEIRWTSLNASLLFLFSSNLGIFFAMEAWVVDLFLPLPASSLF